jgi:D-3-phosphoglycerate dehydrogenase
MVGQISTVLAQENINISEMLNRSKGNYACSIIDVGSEPSAKAVEALYKIKSVVKVRILKLAK